MQIAVWSNCIQGAGATTVTTLLATLTAAHHNYKTLLSHTMTGDLSMENYILDEEEINRIKEVGESGVDGLFRLLKNGKLDPEKIKDYSYSLLSHSNLDFLSSQRVYQDEQGFRHNYLYLLYMARQFYDVVFVDLNVPMESELFSKVLADSDVLLVVGKQNAYQLGELMNKVTHYKDMLRKSNTKILFTINAFDQESTMTVKKLVQPLNIKTPSKITYCVEVIDSCNRHDLVDFVLRHIHSKKKDKVSRFIQDTNQIVEEMMELFQEVANAG